MEFLQLENIHHSYFSSTQAKEVLRDISLAIREGEFVSFIGPSGCGKTTLLSIIAGLFPSTEGKVYIDGDELAAHNQSSIGYMLQQDYLFPWKTIEENVTIEEIVKTAIYFAKDGTKQAIIELTEAARQLRQEKAEMDRVIEVFQSILEKYSPMKDDVHRKVEKIGLPSNHYTPSRLFSIEELPLALAFIVLNDGEYYTSIYDGINSGRDTDSIGVMIGVILGAKYGSNAIREEDIQQLQATNKMDLIGLSDSFAEAAKEIIKEDLELNERRRRYFEEYC